VVCSSPNGEHDPTHQDNAEDEQAGPDHLVVETRFCHAPSLAAVERTTLIWVKSFPRGLSVTAWPLAAFDTAPQSTPSIARLELAGRIGA
jgi:hypothetical protein